MEFSARSRKSVSPPEPLVPPKLGKLEDRTLLRSNTVELAVTYCRGGDCEFVPPLRRGGRGGDFPAEARGIASPRNPPVSPLRKGGIIGSPVPDVPYG